MGRRLRQHNHSAINNKNIKDMKKIIISMMAVAALASCTKSEVQYEPAGEIGFAPFTEGATKAAIDDVNYPTGLNMYVFAATTDNTEGTANFINKGEFTFKQAADGKNLWGGTPSSYYWPNVKKLYFAGVSKSGNVASATTAMNFNTNKLSITGYEPGAGSANKGSNDLMWFSKTAEYGKGTPYVHVDMSHACSWITVKVYGDAVTAGTTPWKVTNITINGLTTKGDVVLGATTTDDNGSPNAAWTLSNVDTDKNKTFVVFNGSTSLKTTATALETTANNTIVIPQTATNMDITYQYTSPAGATISETANVSLALDKSATPPTGANDWEAGYHYTYTVKITASEILIQPDAKTWTETTAPEVAI